MTIDNALLCRMNLESFYVTVQLFVKSISKMLYRDKKSLCNFFYKRQRKIAVKTVSRIKHLFCMLNQLAYNSFSFHFLFVTTKKFLCGTKRFLNLLLAAICFSNQRAFSSKK